MKKIKKKASKKHKARAPEPAPPGKVKMISTILAVVLIAGAVTYLFALPGEPSPAREKTREQQMREFFGNIRPQQAQENAVVRPESSKFEQGQITGECPDGYEYLPFVNKCIKQ